MSFVSFGGITLIDVVDSLPIYKEKCAFAFMFCFWGFQYVDR